MYNSGEKIVSPIQVINEKSTHAIQKFFMLKAQTALATGHFSKQLGFWSAVVPLPPPPPHQYKKGVQYKSGTSIFGRNKNLQYD